MDQRLADELRGLSSQLSMTEEKVESVLEHTESLDRRFQGLEADLREVRRFLARLLAPPEG